LGRTVREVINITLKLLAVFGGSQHGEAYLCGIAIGPNPFGLYGKLKITDFRHALWFNFKLIAAAGLYINVSGTFHATTSNTEILEETVSLQNAGKPRPGQSTVSWILPVIIHIYIII
jgi:hypothetical protein